jgi:hypothetical protein
MMTMRTARAIVTVLFMSTTGLLAYRTHNAGACQFPDMQSPCKCKGAPEGTCKYEQTDETECSGSGSSAGSGSSGSGAGCKTIHKTVCNGDSTGCSPGSGSSK